MKLIRSVHADAFRSGEWAELIGTVDFHGKPCYVVVFTKARKPDAIEGTVGLWVVADGPYEYAQTEPGPNVI